MQNQLQKARDILDKVKEENNIYLTATRGLLLIKEGNIDEGRYYYNRAISLASNNKNLAALVDQKKHLELARYNLDKGNWKEAIRLLKRGLSFKTKETLFKRKIEQLLEENRLAT